MTKPFLSLTEVAQIATDRVEQVMHLPPDGESRHTPSPEQSYGPRALGEAGGLPAVSGLGSNSVTLSSGFPVLPNEATSVATDGKPSRDGSIPNGGEQHATMIGPLGSTSATLSKPQDSRAELVESGPRQSELTGERPAALPSLGAEAGIGSAPGAGAGLAGTAPAVSFEALRPAMCDGSSERLQRLQATAVAIPDFEERARLRAHFVGVLSNYVTDEVWDYCLATALRLRGLK